MTISVDARSKGSQLSDAAKRLANRLKLLHNNNEDAVSKLDVKGPIDEKSHIIDLLGGKLTEEIKVPVSVHGYRMDVEDRWRALYRAYSGWCLSGEVDD